MNVIGIDPGLGGAIALYELAYNKLTVWDCPVYRPKERAASIDDVNLAVLIGNIKREGSTHVYLERAQAVLGMGLPSAFNYGAGYGVYRGIIAAYQLPLTLVQPQKWKKTLALPKDKTVCRRRASELFPASAHYFGRKKDDGRAEAALIAWYGVLELGLRAENYERMPP